MVDIQHAYGCGLYLLRLSMCENSQYRRSELVDLKPFGMGRCMD